MPKFKYLAMDHYGRPKKGVIESPTFQSALDELKSKGLWVTKLLDLSQSFFRRDIYIGGGPRVKIQHFTIFCRQLSSMYKAGVGMVEAVRVLGQQSESKVFRKILLDIADEMQRGNQFSEAASRYPTVFSTVFLSMVRAGEASGNLDDMLQRLAIFYEKEYYTKEKVKSAMVYPVIMTVVTVIVIIILMNFVVPKLVGNFSAMGLQLPLPTRIVIGISAFMRNFWFLVILALLIPPILYQFVKKNEKGKYIIDTILLQLPVFGKLNQKQALSRFSRTFSSLFSAALPVLQLMSIVSTVVGNEALARVIRESREGLRGGNSIAEPFAKSKLFPPMVVQMLAIGERTGNLDTMLDKVADFYEADVDQTADRLKAMLEPIMILILAVIVGTIVLAVMLPSFQLMNHLE